MAINQNRPVISYENIALFQSKSPAYSAASNSGHNLSFLPLVQGINFSIDVARANAGALGTKDFIDQSNRNAPDVSVTIDTIENFGHLFSDLTSASSTGGNLNTDKNFYALLGSTRGFDISEDSVMGKDTLGFGNCFLNNISMSQSVKGLLTSQYTYVGSNVQAETLSNSLGNTSAFLTEEMPNLIFTLGSETFADQRNSDGSIQFKNGRPSYQKVGIFLQTPVVYWDPSNNYWAKSVPQFGTGPIITILNNGEATLRPYVDINDVVRPECTISKGLGLAPSINLTGDQSQSTTCSFNEMRRYYTNDADEVIPSYSTNVSISGDTSFGNFLIRSDSIQNFDLNLPINRKAIYSLGKKYPLKRKALFPSAGSFSFSNLVSSFELNGDMANLKDFLSSDESYSIKIAGENSKGEDFHLQIEKAKLVSQSQTSSMGEKISANLGFSFELNNFKKFNLLERFQGASLAYSLRNISYRPMGNVVEVRRNVDEKIKSFTAAEVADGTLTSFVNESFTSSLPLDVGGSAAAAYALRNLSSSYNGNVVDVRRFIDGATRSYTADEITAGTLTSFANESFKYFDSAGANSVGTVFTNGLQYSFVQGGATMANNLSFSANGGFNDTEKYSFTGAGDNGSYTNNFYFSSSFNVSRMGPSAPNKTVTIEAYVKRTSGSSSDSLYFRPYGTNYSSNKFIVTGLVQDEWTLVKGTLTKDSVVDSRNMIHIGGDTGVTFEISNIKYYLENHDISVSKWYDQSGNDKHAVQTDPTKQPKVVNAGILNPDGIKFDGIDDLLDIGGSAALNEIGIQTTNPLSIYTVQIPSDNSILGDNSNRYLSFRTSSAQYYLSSDPIGFTLGSSVSSTELSLFSTNHGGEGVTSLVQVHANGIAATTIDPDQGTSDANTANAPIEYIGANIGNNQIRYFEKSVEEIIIYKSDQSANRPAIEEGIASHYGITLASFNRDGFVRTWYDQSSSVVPVYEAYSKIYANTNSSVGVTLTKTSEQAFTIEASSSTNDRYITLANISSGIQLGKHRITCDIAEIVGSVSSIKGFYADPDGEPADPNYFSNPYGEFNFSVGSNVIDFEIFDDGEVKATPPIIQIEVAIGSTCKISFSNFKISRVTSESFVQNNNHATQTDPTKQPKIVNAGELITRTINGKQTPSIKFSAGSKMIHGIDDLSSDGQQSLFLVADNQVTAGDSTRLLEIMSSTSDEADRRRPLIYKDSNSTLKFSVDTEGGFTRTQSQSNFLSLYSSITNDTPHPTDATQGGTHVAHQDGIQFGSEFVALDINPSLSTNHEEQLGTLNSNTVGNFYFSEIIYYPSDQSANRASIQKDIINYYKPNTILAEDITRPVITINGPDTINLMENDTYVEQGATTDDGSEVVIDSSTVVTSSAAFIARNNPASITRFVTYNASDAAGNIATSVRRKVIITANA